MAELAGLFSNSENIKEVPVEWLDYTFVDGCNDAKNLRLILDTLKSGREGLYPEVS